MVAGQVSLGSFATGRDGSQTGHVRYAAAESGSDLSYFDATGMNTITETVGTDRPPVAKPAARPRSRKLATVSASALAQHFDCTASTSASSKPKA